MQHRLADARRASSDRARRRRKLLLCSTRQLTAAGAFQHASCGPLFSLRLGEQKEVGAGRQRRRAVSAPAVTPYEAGQLAQLGWFTLGAATGAAALLATRDVLGVPPLSGGPRPRPRLLPQPLSPDRVVAGPGVYLLQHLLQYFYPALAATLAVAARRKLQPSLERLRTATLRDVRLEDLTFGDVVPVINAVKLYDTPPGQVVADIELSWDAGGRLRLGVSLSEGGSLYVPVEVCDLRFTGVVRVVISPLLPAPPFIGGITFSSSPRPAVDFKLRVLGGDVAALPGLREQLQDAAGAALDATFTWPERVLLPFRRARNPADLAFILSPEEQEALRRDTYPGLLSGERVTAWGSAGLTRRMKRLYGPDAASKGRGVAARAVDALGGAARWVWARRPGGGRAAAAAAAAAAAEAAAGARVVPHAAEDEAAPPQQQPLHPPPAADPVDAFAAAASAAERGANDALSNVAVRVVAAAAAADNHPSHSQPSHEPSHDSDGHAAVAPGAAAEIGVVVAPPPPPPPLPPRRSWWRRLLRWRPGAASLPADAGGDAAHATVDAFREATGLPVVLQISVKNGEHSPRVRVQQQYGNTARAGECFSMTVSDSPSVIGDTGVVRGSDIQLIAKFVRLNKRVLLEFWEQAEPGRRALSSRTMIDRLVKVS